jgi:hypothetical protein
MTASAGTRPITPLARNEVAAEGAQHAGAHQVDAPQQERDFAQELGEGMRGGHG